jgi:hypothetical protein
MKTRTALSLSGVLALLCLGSLAHAQVTVSFYGDDDGFGVGQTSGNLTDATTSHAGVGEAPFTDVQLIGVNFDGPAFAPTGSFNAFVLPVGSTITQAVLTLRTGSFDSGPVPVDGVGTNQIFLDGLLVSSAFINSFSQVDSQLIETRTFNLDSSFFSLLADGTVSLNGTHLSEDSGSGSFQVDFLKLEVTTTAPAITAVPEPSTYGLLGAAALIGLVATRRNRTKRSAPIA